MNLSRYFLLLTVLSGSAAFAADPIDLLHKDAAAIIRIQAPETTVKDVAAFIDKIQPGFGAVVQGQAGGLGMVIKNPTLAGVDMTRDWYVMLFASAANPPQPVLLIPATDVEAFKAALGTRHAVAISGDWIAYSQIPELLEAVQAGFDSPSDSIRAIQSEGLLADLQKGHVSVLLNSPSLQATFSDELANAEQQLEKGLQVMANQIAQSGQNIPTEAITGFYGAIGNWMIQAARDSTGGVIRIEINDVELRIEERFTFKEGSQTRKSIGVHPVRPLTQLTQLPEGLAYYIAASFRMNDLLDWSKELMAEFVTDEATQEKFNIALAAMDKSEFGVYAGAFELATSREAALRYMGAMEVKPTAPLRDAFEAMGTGSKYEIAGITQSLSYKRNAETISGEEVDLYEFEQTIPPEMDPLGLQTAMNNRLYGGNVISQRLVYEDDRMLQVLGGNSDDMKQLIESQEWTDATLLDARKRLYPEANMVALADIPRFLLSTATLAAESPALPIPISADQLGQLIIQPTYAGSCFSLADGEVTGRANFPVDMFREVTQAVFIIQGMMNGQ